MTQRIEAFFDKQPIISAEYVLDPGISASAGYAELSPDAFQEIKRNLFRDNHKLSLSAGDQKVEITDLHVNSIEQSHPRAPVKIHFQDRRWKWEKFGGVVEDVNVLDEAGLRIFGKDTRGGWRPFTIDPATNLPWSVESVVHLMLKRMGEKEAKVPALGYLPTSIRLHGHRPAKVIQELISRSNIQISLNSKGGIVFFKRDPHAVINFPEAFKIDEPRAQAFPAIPDKIKLIGSRIRDQETTICEPVFIRPPLDWEAKAIKRREEWKKDKKKKFEEDLPVVTDPNHGTIVTLDSDEGLTFFGYPEGRAGSLEANADSAGDFNAVKDRRGLEIWRIAKQFLFKWWRIKGDETDIKRGWKLWKQTPILKNLNSVIETEGRLQRAPVRLTSSYVCPDPDPKTIAEHVKVDRAWLQDTSLAQRKHGIVITSERTGVWPSNYGKGKNVAGLTQSAKFRDQVWLTYAWELKGTEDIEDAFFVYEFDNPNPLPKVAKKKEGEKDVLWITSRDLIQVKIDGKDQNIEALEKLCNLFCVDYFQQLFAQQKGGSVKLAGFFDYSPGPSIDSVRWSVSSGGAFTIINWGYQHSAMAGLPSPEERIREALAKKNMFIEGDEPYCRKTGQDDEAGAGDFETSNDIQTGDAKRKALGIQNAHHSGPLPMLDKEAGTEDVLFCRVPEIDQEKHLHAIDQLGPLLTSPPDGEEIKPRKNWKWTKCPVWFEPRAGHHGSDGYWFPWVKLPDDVELAEVTEVINPTVPAGSTSTVPQMFLAGSEQQKLLNEKLKGKIKEPRNYEEWLATRKLLLDAVAEVIAKLGVPLGAPKISGEVTGPRFLFPTRQKGKSWTYQPIDLNKLNPYKYLGAFGPIGIKESGKPWRPLVPLSEDERKEKEDDLLKEKNKELQDKIDANKKQIEKVKEGIKTLRALIKFERATGDRLKTLQDQIKGLEEQLVKLQSGIDIAKTTINNISNDTPVYSGPYLKANKIEEPPPSDTPYQPGSTPKPVTTPGGEPGESVDVVPVGAGGIPANVDNFEVGDIITVHRSWYVQEENGIPRVVYTTEPKPNPTTQNFTPKAVLNNSDEAWNLGELVSPDTSEGAPADSFVKSTSEDSVAYPAIIPTDAYGVGTIAIDGQVIYLVKGPGDIGDMIKVDPLTPGRAVVTPTPGDAVGIITEPTPEGTKTDDVNPIYAIPCNFLPSAVADFSDEGNYFLLDASRVITGNTTIEKAAPVILTLKETGGGRTLNLIEDVDEISLLADIYKPGGVGDGVDLDFASSQYVSTAIQPYTVFGGNAQPFTIKGWMRLDSLSGQTYVSFMNASNGAPRFWFLISATGMRVGIGAVNAIAATGAISLGAWHHLVITYDGTTLKIYIDNPVTPYSSAAWAGQAFPNTNLMIGTDPTHALYLWDGMMDEVGIFNICWDAAAVATDWKSSAGRYGEAGDPGLVAGYHFDGDEVNYGGIAAFDATLENGAGYAEAKVLEPGAVHSVVVGTVKDGTDPLCSGIWEWGDTAGYLLFHGEVVQDIDFNNIAGITKLGFLEIESSTPYVDIIDIADGEKSRFSVDSGQPTRTAMVLKPGADKSATLITWTPIDAGTEEIGGVLSLELQALTSDVLDEDCVNFTKDNGDLAWTDGDAGTGVSQIDPAGQFDLHCGAAGAGNYAQRYGDVGSMPDLFTLEIKLYHDLMGNYADNDFFHFVFEQADEKLDIRFATDGCFVKDTDEDKTEVGTGLVKHGGGAEWQIWRFVVSGFGVKGDAVCDAYLQDSTHSWEKVGSAIPCSYEQAGVDGKIELYQYAWTTVANTKTHIDYIKISSGLEPPYVDTFPRVGVTEAGETFGLDAEAGQTLDISAFAAVTSGVPLWRWVASNNAATPDPGDFSASLTTAQMNTAAGNGDFDGFRYFHLMVLLVSDGSFDTEVTSVTITATVLGAVVTRDVVGATDSVRPGEAGVVWLGDETNQDNALAFWGTLWEDFVTAGGIKHLFGSDAEVYADASNNLIITPGTKNVRIGDVVNYVQFAPDGTITFVGDARFYPQIWIQAEGVRAPGANPATFVDLGISGAWQFANALTKVVICKLPLTTDIDTSEDADVNIGWGSPAQSLVCRWQVEYLPRKLDEDMSAAAEGTLTQDETSSATANGQVVSTFIIPAASIDADDSCLLLRITRLGAHANDTLGDVANLSGLCLHYISNKLGTPV